MSHFSPVAWTLKKAIVEFEGDFLVKRFFVTDSHENKIEDGEYERDRGEESWLKNIRMKNENSGDTISKLLWLWHFTVEWLVEALAMAAVCVLCNVRVVWAAVKYEKGETYTICADAMDNHQQNQTDAEIGLQREVMASKIVKQTAAGK
ncbi:hypothetical protein LOK49_LG10G01893 [Camellia lanceoleosa]|uniref:Uncharacterized protein n=1 Tax=Camellia lanceoleosa TaxID=1840588 RepID=A0ACC0G5V5_9ERIC|nr:hypothetical protein LOK49_LG10G01893 [Camellia lanceoleosa]